MATLIRWLLLGVVLGWAVRAFRSGRAVPNGVFVVALVVVAFSAHGHVQIHGQEPLWYVLGDLAVGLLLASIFHRMRVWPTSAAQLYVVACVGLPRHLCAICPSRFFELSVVGLLADAAALAFLLTCVHYCVAALRHPNSESCVGHHLVWGISGVLLGVYISLALDAVVGPQVLWYRPRRGPETEMLALVGKPFPQWTARRFDGSSITSDALRGQPHLVLFASPTCRYCDEVCPAIAGRHGGVPVLVYFGAGNADKERMRAKLRAAGLESAAALDSTMSLFRALSIAGVPALLHVGADGKILGAGIGPPSVLAVLSRACGS